MISLLSSIWQVVRYHVINFILAVRIVVKALEWQELYRRTALFAKLDLTARNHCLVTKLQWLPDFLMLTMMRTKSKLVSRKFGELHAKLYLHFWSRWRLLLPRKVVSWSLCFTCTKRSIKNWNGCCIVLHCQERTTGSVSWPLNIVPQILCKIEISHVVRLSTMNSSLGWIF